MFTHKTPGCGLCYRCLMRQGEGAEPEMPEDAERAAGRMEPTNFWHNNSSVSGWAHVHIWSVRNAIYCVCVCGGQDACMCPSLSYLVLAIYT